MNQINDNITSNCNKFSKMYLIKINAKYSLTLTLSPFNPQNDT